MLTLTKGRQVTNRLMLTVVLVAGTWLVGCESNRNEIATQRAGASANNEDVSNVELEPVPDIMADTHFAAGQLFEKQRVPQKAILQYRRALERDPNHIPSLNRLGELYGQSGQHVAAEVAFRHAVELRPDDGLLRNNLGFEYAMQQRWDEAEKQFRRALQVLPRFERARVNLAVSLAKQGQFDEALTEFQAVLPEPDAYYNLGLMFKAKGLSQDAAGAFQIALDFNPRFDAARTQLDMLQPLLNERQPQPAEVEVSTSVEQVEDQLDVEVVDASDSASEFNELAAVSYLDGDESQSDSEVNLQPQDAEALASEAFAEGEDIEHDDFASPAVLDAVETTTHESALAGQMSDLDADDLVGPPMPVIAPSLPDRGRALQDTCRADRLGAGGVRQ